jgi:catechol 2,3-dioxygenase-like lactoylglutathione lyase family enzyme
MRPPTQATASAAEPQEQRPDDSAPAVPLPGLQLASVALYVADLARSVRFYRELLRLTVSAETGTAALLVGANGTQLYLRSVGSRAPHVVGGLGVQCTVWTAASAAELVRCEQVLKNWNAYTTSRTDEGFDWVEGRDPSGVPVMVSYPGPEHAPRRRIMPRIYAW